MTDETKQCLWWVHGIHSNNCRVNVFCDGGLTVAETRTLISVLEDAIIEAETGKRPHHPTKRVGKAA